MYLTDLWIVLPDWLFYRVLRWAGVEQDAAHRWLCEVWGCRCPEELRVGS